jgi:hypothetical protein
MITETLSQLSTIFRRRFLFNALLPTLVFASLLSALVVTSFGSLHDLGAWWVSLDVLSKAITVLGYLAVVWFLAGAVASQWRGIVRFFEGYPVLTVWHRAISFFDGYPILRVLHGHVPGIVWHRTRRRELWAGSEDGEVDPDAHKAYPRYPLLEEPKKDGGEDEDEDGEVLPTRLGNILRAAELYPVSHYGMDPIYFWPRLFPLLPEQFRAEYEEFILNYEFPLVVAFESMIVAVLGGVIVLVSGGPPLLYLLCLGGGSLIAFMFYQLSLSSAEEIGEQQRTAFDLYRHLLLEQWPTPADVKDEQAAFAQIQEFIVSNMIPSWGRPQQLHHRRHRPSRPS